jgi:peroxiredoxin Q/BCP
MAIQAGDPAPDFTLNDQHGKPFTLSSLKGKTVVFYFYPKDETAICTREACSFRDAYEEFTKAGAVVVGASGDSAGSHDAFSRRLNLPFTLVADEGNKVRALYGVPKTFALLPGRTTYVIDKDGVVRHVFSAAFTAQGHVDEALAVVKRLAAT